MCFHQVPPRQFISRILSDENKIKLALVREVCGYFVLEKLERQNEIELHLNPVLKFPNPKNVPAFHTI